MDSSKPNGEFAVHSSVNEQLPATVAARADNPVGGSELEPAAVQPRSASPLQSAGDPVILSLSVPNSSSGLFTSTLTSANEDRVQQFLRYQLYIGAVLPTTALPGLYSTAQFPRSEWSPVYDSSGVVFKAGVDVRKLEIRNNSGVTQLFYIVASAHYLCNRTDNAAWTTSFVLGL